MTEEIKENTADWNRVWEQRLRGQGVDFVRFVDITSLPETMTGGYPRAVLFGKSLSKDYIRAIRDSQKPATKEIFNTERKMDAIAVILAQQLTEQGYPSVGKLKTGQLPHKTVALRAGLGFIGKNNLLITPAYGCALMLGKVLTAAPFLVQSQPPAEPQCGDCRLCVEICPTGALLDKTWSVTTTREQILTRKLCTLCHKCMAVCPYTAAYIR